MGSAMRGTIETLSRVMILMRDIKFRCSSTFWTASQRAPTSHRASWSWETPIKLASDYSKTPARKASKNLKSWTCLEFKCIIHAEMSAISDAARKGVAIQGATLYSTTFPCHLCAKHIVASGIKRVVYLEPYPKSYANALHGESNRGR